MARCYSLAVRGRYSEPVQTKFSACSFILGGDMVTRSVAGLMACLHSEIVEGAGHGLLTGADSGAVMEVGCSVVQTL